MGEPGSPTPLLLPPGQRQVNPCTQAIRAVAIGWCDPRIHADAPGPVRKSRASRRRKPHHAGVEAHPQPAARHADLHRIARDAGVQPGGAASCIERQRAAAIVAPGDGLRRGLAAGLVLRAGRSAGRLPARGAAAR